MMGIRSSVFIAVVKSQDKEYVTNVGNNNR